MTDYKIERWLALSAQDAKPLKHGGAVDALRRGHDIVVHAVGSDGRRIGNLVAVIVHTRDGERIDPGLYPVSVLSAEERCPVRHAMIYADVLVKAARIALEAYPDQDEFAAMAVDEAGSTESGG